MIGEAPAEAVALLDREAARATLRVSFADGLVPARGGLDGFLARVFATVHEARLDGSWQRLKACPNCHWAFWDESARNAALRHAVLGEFDVGVRRPPNSGNHM